MTDNSSKIQIKAKPKICAIDLDQEIIEAIQLRGLDCFAGTLGSQIKVPNSRQRDWHQCRLNCIFPPNLHEYDIVVVDLKAREPVEYKESEHKRLLYKGSAETILVSSYPETLFDPRPLSASILQHQLKELFNKETLIIVFSAQQEEVEYNSLVISSKYGSYGGNDSCEHTLYDFLPCVQLVHKKIGRNTVVTDINETLNNFLCKYNDSFVYEATFKHPIEWVANGRKSVERDNFFPLLVNQDDETVGFVDCLFDPTRIFVFPQIIQGIKEFILELIDEILPGLYPTIFPYSEQFSWLKFEKYFLPNQAELLFEKEKLKNEYNKALKKLDKKIKQNQAQYQFLHDLLSETGTSLVETVECFFNWLGFMDVTNMDEANPELKEEDLQVALENGLLVIEIKGIGGTSKDKECSQINKIKYRRAEERNSFDVYALYIVNHQRYLPPTERKNPPFSKQQIADAKSEKRGLLTTYELYNLYSKIEQGLITKEDTRSVLTKYGLVEFKPSNAHFIGCPLETHHQGKVIILNIENISIYQGAKIIVCNDETWIMAKILEIRVNDETVESVSDGEIGLKLSHSILKTSELWLQMSKE